MGDGTVLMHDISRPDTDVAKDLNSLIKEANPTSVTKIRSEIAWSPDFDLLMLGNDDG